MSSKRKPKYDGVLGGVRVRVYTTRTDREVVFGDDEIDAPGTEVWFYPRVLDIVTVAQLAQAERASRER